MAEVEHLRSKMAIHEQLLETYERTVIRQAGRIEEVLYKLQAQWEVLHAVVAGTASMTGDEFFRSLISHLASALKVRHAFIGEMMEGEQERIHTLAVWSGDRFIENIDYDLRGTPCATTVRQSFCHYESGVQHLFPDDGLLVEMGAESYCGVPLIDRCGLALGLLVVMHDRPIEPVFDLREIMKVFAARAAVELERKREEEARRESEAFKNQILQSSPDCIKVLDLEGRLLFMNKGGQDTLEMDDIAPVLNSQWIEFWKGEDKQASSAAVEAARAGDIGRFVGFCPTATGKPRWWDVLVTPLPDAEGKPYRLLAISRDVTERKQVEAMRDQLAVIVESSDDAIISRALDGTILSWNRGAQAMFGYTAEEMVGKPITALLPPERLDEGRDIVERLRAGERIDRFQTVRRRKNGQKFDVSLSVSPVRDERGQVIGVSQIFHDITESKQAEEIRAHVAAIVESSDDAIIGVSLDGTVLTWNLGAELMLGYRPDEIIGRPLSLLYPDCGSAETCAVIERLVRGHRVNHFETIQRHQNGDLIAVSLSVSPIKYEEGCLIGVAYIARNITDRRRAQQELLTAHDRLRNLTQRLVVAEEEERRRLSRELHDEFGQALTALKFDLVWIEKQLDKRSTTPLPQRLGQRLQSMADEMDALIQSTRRITTGLRPSILDDLGFIAALKWLVEEFQARAGRRCRLSVSQSVKSVSIGPTSSTTLFRISQELLTNVLRHADATGVSIRVTKKADWFELFVRDDGKGIRASDIAQITTLGLRGIEERAALLRGTFAIHGNPGRGTVAHVRIPWKSLSDV